MTFLERMRRRNPKVAGTSRAVGLCVSLCIGLLTGPCAAGEVVRVGGTGSGSGALLALARAYERQHPNQSIQVLPSIGSTGGIRAVADRKLDLGCISRAMTKEEQTFGLDEQILASTAFVFATAADTTAGSLTLKEVEDIYACRRTTWRDGQPIRLVLRPRSDTAHAYLSGFTPGMKASLDLAHALPGVCVGITDQESLTQLERMPGSFGTAVLGLIVAERRQVRALAVDGIPPTSPDYPFFLTLRLVFRPRECSAAARAFLAFAQSKEGRQIITQAGYRPMAEPARGAR